MAYSHRDKVMAELTARLTKAEDGLNALGIVATTQLQIMLDIRDMLAALRIELARARKIIQ